MHVTLYVDVEPHVLLGAVEDSNQGVWEVLVLPYIVTRNATVCREIQSTIQFKHQQQKQIINSSPVH